MTKRSSTTSSVGYGMPPKHTQFKPGRSGNPKGRPKGTRNFRTELHETLNAPVQVTTDGKDQRVSTRKASLLRMRQQALAGNQRALDRLISLAQRADEDEEMQKAPAASAVSEEDARLIALFRERILREAAVPQPPQDGDDVEGPNDRAP
jgi:hypothetical protein